MAFLLRQILAKMKAYRGATNEEPLTLFLGRGCLIFINQRRSGPSLGLLMLHGDHLEEQRETEQTVKDAPLPDCPPPRSNVLHLQDLSLKMATRMETSTPTPFTPKTSPP